MNRCEFGPWVESRCLWRLEIALQNSDVPGFVPDGFDRGYTSVVSNGSATTLERLPEATADWDVMGPLSMPFQAMLLVDQSDSAIRDDPAEHRLLAAKYLLNDASSFFSVVLGAFAADSTVDHRLSQLPQQPLTLFPVEDPHFTNDGRGYFSILDRLGTMEGGASALYHAVDRAIDLRCARSATT